MSDLHEDPATDYERMLDRNGLECSMYGCWKPIAAFSTAFKTGCGRGEGNESALCADHAQEHGHVTRWLES